MPNVKSYIIKQINRHLYGIQTIQEIAENVGLTSSIQALQDWQNKRFLITHKDIHENPDSKEAIEVLVYTLFSQQAFMHKGFNSSERITKACRFLPKEILRMLASGLQLNLISLELDFELAQKTKTTSINQDIYAHTYLVTYNTSLRQKQLSTVKQLGDDIATLNLYWGTASLLALYKRPAKFFGVEELHEFIELVYRAFNQTPDSKEFFNRILSKESELMTENLQHSPTKLKA